MLTIQFGDLLPTNVPNWQVFAFAGVLIAVTLVFYLLRSIGLFTLAKRKGIKHAFVAWIPCFWMYIACKLIGKARFFGKPMEKIAVWLAIIFTVSELITLVTEFLIYFPVVGNFLVGREICIAGSSAGLKAGFEEWTTGIFVGPDFVNPYGAATFTLQKVLDLLSYLGLFFDIASIVITVSVYINLFRSYWPQHHVLATLMSLFLGLFAPFVFAIRKKEPISYLDYMRSRYNYNPYGNPYNNNPYNNNPYGNQYGAPQDRPPEHPFSEFAERGEVDPGDPFKEFDQKEDKEGK